VWNNELTRAFWARKLDAIARGVSDYKWQKAWKAVTESNKDIYEQNCKEGGTKIVNKPGGIPADPANLLENIVKGITPVIPPGFEKYDTANNGDGQVPAGSEDLSNHPYLRSIHYRGGGYAIFMAFHSERIRRNPDFQGPLHKLEIISLGQVIIPYPAKILAERRGSAFPS
jgi:hypothetical protein